MVTRAALAFDDALGLGRIVMLAQIHDADVAPLAGEQAATARPMPLSRR
jgi:hypothetical protein